MKMVRVVNQRNENWVSPPSGQSAPEQNCSAWNYTETSKVFCLLDGSQKLSNSNRRRTNIIEDKPRQTWNMCATVTLKNSEVIDK